MATNYAQLAFGDAAKALQIRYGSRSTYARLGKQTRHLGLSDTEVDFIRERDGFYLATVGENEFPYVQYRGGPAGFLKVLDEQTLGFLDLRGNRQYISTGNLTTRPKAALILMDYAGRSRLKLFVTTSILSLDDDPALTAQLQLDNAAHSPVKAERIMLLHVEAYDWNCPQHITPRYTAEEIRPLIASYQEQLAQRAQQIDELTRRLAQAQMY